MGGGGPSGLPGLGGLPGDSSWEPLPRSGLSSHQPRHDMSNLGDMFDPMGMGGFGSMDQMSSAGDFLDPMGGGVGLSQGSSGSRGADSSSAWEAACSSVDQYSMDQYGGGGSSSDPFGRVMEPFGGKLILFSQLVVDFVVEIHRQ